MEFLRQRDVLFLSKGNAQAVRCTGEEGWAMSWQAVIPSVDFLRDLEKWVGILFINFASLNFALWLF